MRRIVLLTLIAVMLLTAGTASVMAYPTRGRSIAPWNVWQLDPASPLSSYLPRDHMGVYWGRDYWVQRSVKTGAPASTDCFYLIGGRTAVDPLDSLNSDKGTVTGRVERFNPQTNKLEAVADLPHPRMNAATAAQWVSYWRQDPNNPTDLTKRVKDDTLLIYVFGGTDDQGNPVTAVDVFNTQTQTWNDTTTPIMSLNDPANPSGGNPAYWDNTVTPPVLRVMAATDTNDKITDSGKRGVASALPVGMDAPMVTEFSDDQSGNNTGGFVKGAQGPNPDPYRTRTRFHIISTSPTPVFYLYDWINDIYRLASDTTDPDVLPLGTMVRPGPLPADFPVLKGACGTRTYDIYGGRSAWYNYIFGGQKSDGTTSSQAWRGTLRHKDEGWTPLPDMLQPVYWAGQMTTYMRPWICTGDQTDMPIVVGGNMAPGVYSNKVQGYIGGPYRQWVATSPTDIFPYGLDMPEARGERPAVGVFSYKNWWPSIWVFGGQTAPGVFASTILRAEVNDQRYIMPAQRPDRIVKGWQRIADIPTPRWVAPSAMVDGKIYVIGGITGPNTDPNKNQKTCNTVECYDTATNTWSTKAPMIWNVKDGQAVAAGRKIYVMGGQMDDKTNFPVTPNDGTVDPPVNPAASNNIMQIYDVDTNTWTASVLRNPDGTMVKNPDGTPWINPDCPTLPVAAACAAVCATSDGLIHVLGGSLDGSAGWNNNWSRSHQVYDPVAKKWYRNVRTIDADHPFMCPENSVGHQNQGAEVICNYDESGNKTHEWIYLVCGNNGDGDVGRIFRLDWMACKAWTTPMPKLWDNNNFLNALWDDQGTFADPKGWPEWQKMVPNAKTGVLGNEDYFRGFAGARNQVGHCVVTDRFGVKRVLVLGGTDSNVDDQVGGAANKDEFYNSAWRAPRTGSSRNDGIGVYVYHSPEEPLPISDCTTYECHMPIGKNNRPAVFQAGNYIYVLSGNTRGINPVTGSAGVFAQPYCFKAMINDGSGNDIVFASRVSDITDCPYDYKVQFTAPQTVTRVNGNTCFWIEDASRACGLMVAPAAWPAGGITPGDKIVALEGNILLDTTTGQNYLQATSMAIDYAQHDESAIPAVVGASNRNMITKTSSLGSGRLVKIWGRATISESGVPNNNNAVYVYIDDGSGLKDGVDPSGATGIKVYESVMVDTYLSIGDYLSVTGILSYEYDPTSKKVMPVLYSDSYLGYSPADRIITPKQ